MGQHAVLVEVDSLDAAVALRARLEATRPPGVVDLVPAARTVLVRVDPARVPLAAVRSWVAGATTDAAAAATADAPLVELEVGYDGADLAETAELLGVSADELVRAHAAAEWTVAFTGFAPGFGYLISPDWTFDVPRLPSPRTRVPRGAVGLAAGFTGAYPRDTPGGWRLIGTTSAALFDPDAASPVLLSPGTRVRFRPVAPGGRTAAAPSGGRAATAPSDNETAAAPSDNETAAAPSGSARAPRPGAPGLQVLEPGLLATVQDLGRAGSASWGVAGSGALDRGALRTANRLLGNPEDAAAVEVTMGAFRAVALRDLWFAVTGAWGPIRLDGRERDPYEAHPWPAGAQLQLDWFDAGARAYLAVRGGIDAAPVLGSRASDVLAGIGRPPLRAGDALPVGAEPADAIPVAVVAPWGAPHDDEIEVALAPGPRADWFAASALSVLYEAVWTVTTDADRVGMRLDGPALARTRTDELPSEGMVPGALQVPPSGRPTILLADGPVTGGYPVLAVATDAALDLLAQARPGARVRFRHARPA
ncbi:5-oxoprolinase/urea amidolyase family protein [Microbacterium sp. zg.B48]|nr:5-oxoprolinase/urea amidolyase family protein [Microbacterium sp. zg.B48]MCR2763213.1 5-oxoprolinase/urea amidolyase family protein [Microbacterium sp. zg.B48]